MNNTVQSFDCQLAKSIGTNPAIFISKLDWMLKSEKMGTNIHGQKWIFNTYKLWIDRLFPSWSIRSLKRYVAKLKKLGVIIIRHWNSKRRNGPFKDWGDQTNFYTIDYARLAMLKRGEINVKTGEIISTPTEPPECKSGTMVEPKKTEKQPEIDTNTPECQSGTTLVVTRTPQPDNNNLTHERGHAGASECVHTHEEQPTDYASSLVLGDGDEANLQIMEDAGRIGLIDRVVWRILLKARLQLGTTIDTPLVRKYCPKDQFEAALQVETKPVRY